MSVTVIIKAQAQAGKADALKAGVMQLVNERTRQQPGNQSTTIYQNSDDPHSFTLIELWDSVEAHKAHEQSMIEDGTLAQVGEILAGPPSTEYLTAV